MANQENVSNIRAVKATGHTDLLRELNTKIDAPREDHRRQSTAIEALRDQLARTHTEVLRIKGESRAILPSADNIRTIQDQMLGAARKIQTIEGIVFSIHDTTNETQGQIRRILKAVIPGATSEEEPEEQGEGEGDGGVPMPIGAPREPEGGDGESDAGEASEDGPTPTDDNEGATGPTAERDPTPEQERAAGSEATQQVEAPAGAPAEAPAPSNVTGRIERAVEGASRSRGSPASRDLVEAAKKNGVQLLEDYHEDCAGRKQNYKKSTLKSVNDFLDRREEDDGEAILEFLELLREVQYVSVGWLDNIVGLPRVYQQRSVGGVTSSGRQTMPSLYQQASKPVRVRRRLNRQAPRRAAEAQRVVVDLTEDEDQESAGEAERAPPCTTIVARRSDIENTDRKSGATGTSASDTVETHRAKRTKLATIEESTEEQATYTPRDCPPAPEIVHLTRRFTPEESRTTLANFARWQNERVARDDGSTQAQYSKTHRDEVLF